MKRIKSDKIIYRNRLFDGYVYWDGEKITSVTTDELPVTEEYDVTGYYVSAGWIDIHTHGGGGNAFEGSLEEIVAGCNFHLCHGTTSICPTVSAASFESMAASVRNIQAAMQDTRVGGTILGAHLEGPYLSKSQMGAQCPAFITPPIKEDYLPLLREYGDAIARWSYAPEHDKNAEFAKALHQFSVVSSAGHTNAIYDDMMLAMENGCNPMVGMTVAVAVAIEEASKA